MTTPTRPARWPAVAVVAVVAAVLVAGAAVASAAPPPVDARTDREGAVVTPPRWRRDRSCATGRAATGGCGGTRA